MSALANSHRRLGHAIDAANTADEELVSAAVEHIALQANEDHPEATAVWLEWSDQGDFLAVRGIVLDGQETFWENEEVDNVACNLSGHVAWRWLEFVEPTDRETNRANFRLPVQATIVRTASTRTVAEGEEGR
ncbi:hypothetical protein ACFVBP_10320 [Nocardioides sp. NPDC057764]|uniref:hypothetical protein n=1 Tax=Nocardioides sp. NPDC057764 TaxID=3346243 RepID=UPI0036731909